MHKYSIKIDLVFLCFIGGKIKALIYLMKNQKDWSLPNFYLDEEKDIELASKNVLSKLIYNDLSNSSFINFKTKIDDVLPSCISLSYIVINKFEKIRMSYNSKLSDLNWVELNDHPELNEKQRDIFKKSKIYLENLIKNSPKKVLYFLPKYFTLSELQHSLQILVNDNKNFKEKRNFRKWVKQYNNSEGFIKETKKLKYGKHRPAKLFTSL